MSAGHFLVSVPGRPRAAVGLSVLLVCAFAGGVRGQNEPGPTPRPQSAEPPRQPTEEELVRLPKDHEYFKSIQDEGPFLNRGKPITDPKLGYAATMELKAYDFILAHAMRQPVERLRKYSIKNVPVENLFHPIRQDYVRELLHFEGRLAAVLEMKPTDELRDLDGAQHLYEAWVSLRGSDKFACLVVTELPPGIAPGENQTANVAFDAYFFKEWHYESRRVKDPSKDADKRQWERAAMFLGRTFDVRPQTPEPTYSPMTLALVVTGLLALGMVALGIGLWFRRSDRRVQAGTRDRLHELVSFDEIPESPAPANRIGDRF
jgi:hypothetical protein